MDASMTNQQQEWMMAEQALGVMPPLLQARIRYRLSQISEVRRPGATVLVMRGYGAVLQAASTGGARADLTFKQAGDDVDLLEHVLRMAGFSVAREDADTGVVLRVTGWHLLSLSTTDFSALLAPKAEAPQDSDPSA